MARQHGLLNFTGQLGGVSFYVTKEDGYLARMKSGHTREKVMHDPRLVRVKENSLEFGKASTAGKVLRKAVRHLSDGVADSRMYTRMTGAMRAVVKADAVHVRGERVVLGKNLGMLCGFEFNKHAKFEAVFQGACEVVTDFSLRVVTCSVKEFMPEMVAAPPGATHARFVMGLAAVDFGDGTWEVKERYSSYLDLREERGVDVALVQEMPEQDAPVVVVLGISFFQEVNGEMCRMISGNAMVVVGKIDTGENANIEHRSGMQHSPEVVKLSNPPLLKLWRAKHRPLEWNSEWGNLVGGFG